MKVKLTEKQKRFCDEYLIDLNATRAYKAAYKTCKKDETANVNGSRLLANAKVKAYLEKRIKDREKRTEITQDKVLKELAKIGFSDTTDYARIVERVGKNKIINDDGEVVGEEEYIYKTVDLSPTDHLTPDQRRVIESIKEGKYGIELRLHDKVKALELIGKHLGMFTEKTELDAEEQRARILVLKSKANEDSKEALFKLDEVLGSLGGVMNED